MSNSQEDMVRGRHFESLAAAVSNEFSNLSVGGGASYDVFTGATTDNGTSGLVPAPQAGDNGKFLRGDGVWATVESGSSGGGADYVIGSKVSSVEGGFWQDTINDAPVLKLRHGDYEYNFAYDNITYIGGASSVLETVTPNTYVLGTASVSTEGGVWYEVTDNVPQLKLHAGNFNYGFNYDSITYKGGKSHLVAYLPFDASTTADACGNEWTATGDVSIDTTTKKFGTASLKIGNGEGHALKAGSIININADKWTFDVWYYRDASNTSFHLGLENSHTYEKTGIAILYNCAYLPNATNQQTQVFANYNFTVGEWTHVAIVKNGSNVLFFKNGQLVETFTLTGNFLTGGGVELGYIGTCASNLSHYDSLRFFEGVALWTSDFTPPTAADYL